MKALIIHDDLKYAENLKNKIEKNSSIEVEIFKYTEEAMIFLLKDNAEIVFIEKDLNEFGGACFSDILKKFKCSPTVELIEDQDSIDKVLKKLDLDYRKNSLNKLSKQINIINENKISVVKLEDILFCEARERYTYVYTDNCEYKLRSSISDVEKMISNKYFFKCHRSYLVNLLKVEEITPWFNNTYMLKLNKGKYSVPVSRNNIKTFRYFMNI